MVPNQLASTGPPNQPQPDPVTPACCRSTCVAPTLSPPPPLVPLQLHSNQSTSELRSRPAHGSAPRWTAGPASSLRRSRRLRVAAARTASPASWRLWEHCRGRGLQPAGSARWSSRQTAAGPASSSRVWQTVRSGDEQRRRAPLAPRRGGPPARPPLQVEAWRPGEPRTGVRFPIERRRGRRWRPASDLPGRSTRRRASRPSGGWRLGRRGAKPDLRGPRRRVRAQALVPGSVQAGLSVRTGTGARPWFAGAVTCLPR